MRFDSLEECVGHIKSIPCCVEIGELMNGHAQNADIEQENNENGNQTTTTAATKPTIQIVGVEIDNTSINLEHEPFTSSVAFMMGNEGSGMTKKQMSICDSFVRISQHGGGTASLNVSVAAGVVLHRFFHWGVRGEEVRRYCD